MSRLRRSSARALLVALAALLGVAPPGAAEAGDTGERLGWHGETMPEGMVRSGSEGEYVWEKDGAVMVYVPPGPFPMGSEEGHPDERPVHEIWLDGYYIDKYEVTWGRWKRSGLPYLEEPSDRGLAPSAPAWGIRDRYPVGNVSWRDATAYATWAGKRLPSEAEWEKAARGTDGRVYPWGSEPPTPERAVWKGHPISTTSNAPVDCCSEGASPYGVFNMAGNVYEWCLDVYDPDYYERSPARNPVNLEDGKHRVLRGGAFPLEVDDLRSALRYRLLEVDRGEYIGFRTAVSAPGGAERSEIGDGARDRPP